MPGNPTVTLAALIAACKGAGMDVSDAERMADRLQAMRDRQITGISLVHGDRLSFAECYRAAINACIVAAIHYGYEFSVYRGLPEVTTPPDKDGICKVFSMCGPTPADALYAALGGKV